MDDNINGGQNGGAQPVSPQPMPTEPQPTPVAPQPQSQPMPVDSQPQPQSITAESQPMPTITGQPVEQPMVTNPTPMTIGMDATNSNNGTPKKNNMALIGALIGGGVAIIAAVVLAIVFLGGGGKTVSCVSNFKSMGINVEAKYNVRIKDGEISGGDVTMNADLKNISEAYADDEEEVVNEAIDTYERQCKSDCSMEKEYVKGDHLKIVLKYGKEGAGKNIVHAYGIEDMSAQEIADKVQEALEDDSNTTCKQN